MMQAVIAGIGILAGLILIYLSYILMRGDKQ